MPNISPHIFREYDIRGEVPGELNADNAELIAAGFAAQVAKMVGKEAPVIHVGYDGRLSSPALKDAVIRGLQRGGATARDIGLGPTPLTYFSVFHLDADGCVMITGSHNPPQYNGLKLMVGKKPFFGEMIQTLGKSVMESVTEFVEVRSQAEIVDLKPTYLEALIKAGGVLTDDLHVIWDCGNGAAGEMVQQLAAKLGGRHEVLFGEIDGTFPNHHPDPSVEVNMQDLKAAVLSKKASIGIAFDGDGDRIGVVDFKGRIWAGDQLLAVLAMDVLHSNPGATIIVDVKTSQAVIDAIATHGGKPLVWKTGHSNIKSKLAEMGAPLAGEMSGHVFFADEYYGIDDALYAACRLLRLMSTAGKTSAELYDALPQWVSTPEMRIHCAEEQKFAIVAKVASQLAAEKADVNTIDGVRVQLAEGWWLLRASNTQPVLVARAEAKNASDLQKLVADLNHRLASYQLAIAA